MTSVTALLILVAGPCRSGTRGDPAHIADTVEASAVSLALDRRGHLPVMGEWFALPGETAFFGVAEFP